AARAVPGHAARIRELRQARLPGVASRTRRRPPATLRGCRPRVSSADRGAQRTSALRRHRLLAARSVAYAGPDPGVDVRDRDAPLLLGPSARHAVLAQRAVQRTFSLRDRRALSRLVGKWGPRGRNAQRARTGAPRGAVRRDGEAHAGPLRKG